LFGSDTAVVTLTTGNLSASSFTGNITVTAGAGANTITVGNGTNTITGGGGADVLTAAPEPTNLSTLRPPIRPPQPFDTIK